MSLSQHYRVARSLSPRAARAAARMLDRAINIPPDWRLSLRMALLERSRTAGPTSPSELMPLLALHDEPDPPRPRPHEQAIEFMQAVQSDIRRAPADDA